MEAKFVLPILALVFASWTVSLGGIASLQQACKDMELEAPANVPESAIIKDLGEIQKKYGKGIQLPSVMNVQKGGKFFLGAASLTNIRGFSATVRSCKQVYSYYWFIVAFEFCLVVGALLTIAAGGLRATRASLMGLFVIATLLYIQSTDSFLTAQDVDWYKHGKYQHRARTMTAGCFMTATSNLLLIFVLGLEPAATGKAS